MNLPNILTLIRFIMVPFLGYYLYLENYKLSMIIFLLAGLTDILDGYIARKYNMVTKWGKFADPLADKLIQTMVLAMLTINEVIPSPLLIVLVTKELLLGVGAIILYKKDIVLSSNWYGKFATVIFYIAVVIIIIVSLGGIDLSISTFMKNKIINILVVVAVGCKLFALGMYTKSFIGILKGYRIGS